MLAAACDRLLFPRESRLRAEQQRARPSPLLQPVVGDLLGGGAGGPAAAADSSDGGVLPRILSITWPILVDRLTTVLVGLVSIFLVGQSGSAAELAAIGLGNVLVRPCPLADDVSR